MTEIEKFRKRRLKRLLSRGVRLDADDDDSNSKNAPSGKKTHGHGNTRLPYGLAKGEGMKTKGMTPKEVWEMLSGEGYSPSTAYSGLKEGKTGKELKTPKKPESPKEPRKVSHDTMLQPFKEKSAGQIVKPYLNLLNDTCKDDDVMRLIGAQLSDPHSEFAGFKVSRSDTDTAFFRYTSGGPFDIKIPRISPSDTPEEKNTKLRTFLHEYTHLLNHYGDNHVGWLGAFTDSSEELKNAISEESSNTVSDSTKKMFSEFAKEYEALGREYNGKINDAKNETIKKFFPNGRPSWVRDDGSINALMVPYRDLKTAKEYEKARDTAVRKLVREAAKKGRSLQDGMSSLQGLYDSITSGKAKDSKFVKFGHKLSYFDDEGKNAANELLSDYVSLAATRPDLLKVFESDYPKTAKCLRETMKKLADRCEKGGKYEKP